MGLRQIFPVQIKRMVFIPRNKQIQSVARCFQIVNREITVKSAMKLLDDGEAFQEIKRAKHHRIA